MRPKAPKHNRIEKPKAKKPKAENPGECLPHRRRVEAEGCMTRNHECNGDIVSHHVQVGLPERLKGGKGKKAPDGAIVALCDHHHRLQHNMGQRTFEARYGVDLAARALWNEANSPQWQAHYALMKKEGKLK